MAKHLITSPTLTLLTMNPLSINKAFVQTCHGLSLPMNRVCTGQSSDSERGSAE